MDAGQALAELVELSSQITSAVVLDSGGDVLAAVPDEASAASLAMSARELLAAASDLGGGQEVTRVEVELDEGAVFAVREGERTVAATTGPSPTSGLVVYDLRTCARKLAEPAPKARRTRKPKEPSA